MAATIMFPECPGRCFDAETTALMCEAFDKSCQTLRGSSQLDSIRDSIARRIIEIAGNGERDPNRMCEAALSSIGIRGNMADLFIS